MIIWYIDLVQLVFTVIYNTLDRHLVCLSRYDLKVNKCVYMIPDQYTAHAVVLTKILRCGSNSTTAFGVYLTSNVSVCWTTTTVTVIVCPCEDLSKDYMIDPGKTLQKK